MNQLSALASTLAFGLALSAAAQAPVEDNPPPAPLGDADGLRVATPQKVAPPPPPLVEALPPPSEMDVARPFYNDLAPYGRWQYTNSYGYVWQPSGTPYGWRPYTRGQWTYTDDGWYWASAEAWSDDTFHYGRWNYMPRRGWVWIPGRVWAPAWVVWRSGPGYLGWAPLPHEARYDPVTGITWYVSMDRAIYADGWIFVDDRYVMNPYVYGYIYPPQRNVIFIRSTTVYNTGYAYRRGRVYGGGVPVDRVQRATGRRIEARPYNDRARVQQRPDSSRSGVRGRDNGDSQVRGRPSNDDNGRRGRDDSRTSRPRNDDRRGRQTAPAPQRSAPRSAPPPRSSGGGRTRGR